MWAVRARRTQYVEWTQEFRFELLGAERRGRCWMFRQGTVYRAIGVPADMTKAFERNVVQNRIPMKDAMELQLLNATGTVQIPNFEKCLQTTSKSRLDDSAMQMLN